MQFNFKIKYLIIIFLLIMGYLFLFTQELPQNQSLCIFKNVTGLPCPACGSTRATAMLLHGDLTGSILLNPFGFLTSIFILVSIVWMIRDVLKNRETFLPALKKNWNLPAKVILLLILLANWIWNISKGL